MPLATSGRPCAPAYSRNGDLMSQSNTLGVMQAGREQDVCDTCMMLEIEAMNWIPTMYRPNDILWEVMASKAVN